MWRRRANSLQMRNIARRRPARRGRAPWLWSLALLSLLFAACDPLGPDTVGVGLSEDGTALIVFLQPCREPHTVLDEAVFVPSDVRVWTKENIVKQPVWEFASVSGAPLSETRIDQSVDGFDVVTPFAGSLPPGELWAYVRYREGKSTYEWEDALEFRVSDLREGMVYSDGRLMTREEFFNRDTCTPPKDEKPLSRRWIDLIRGHLPVAAAIVGLVLAGGAYAAWTLRRSSTQKTG